MISRLPVILLLLAVLLPAQNAPWLAVSTKADPARARTLAEAGYLTVLADAWVAGPATEAFGAAVRARGWPARAIDGPAPLEELYLVPCEHTGATAFQNIARLIHEEGGEALVAILPGQRDALLDLVHARHPGHAEAVRVLGDPVRPVAPTDWLAHTGRSPGRGVTADPVISGLVAQVSQPNLLATVTALSSMWTRRSDQPGGVTAQNQVVAWFQAIPGLTVTTHSYNSDADNVIAELPGVVDPSRIVIIGAHYDSIAGSAANNAPGADDNASGSAAVLEVARILSQETFAYTIRFVTFSSEEFGLVGSGAYAQELVNQGADMVAMVNTDMNAYTAAGQPVDVTFVLNDTSAALNLFAQQVCAAYVPELPFDTGSLSGGTSDHRSFHQRGVPAVFPFEDLPSYSPFIHTINDTVGTSANDFVQSARITRLLTALVAELAVPTSITIGHTALTDTGDTDGPYRVVCDVASLQSYAITSVTLMGAGSQGPFSIPMVPGPGAGAWIADIPGQPLGTQVDYWIEAQDSGNNQGTWPAGPGAMSSFRVAARQIVFGDDFESGAPGWTHGRVATQDDWQLGTPQGASTDPSSAYSGANVWANDLGASGWNGAYANNVHNWLRSPSIDCTGYSQVHLVFQRWLGVEDGTYDQASILVNGTQVWTNPATPGGTSNLIDAQWTPMEIDISALADGNPAVQVEFRLQSDGGVTFGGWTVDNFEITADAPVVARSLVADRTFTGVALPAAVGLELDLGPGAAGLPYILLPSLAGSSPGTLVNGSLVPLNLDDVSLFVLMNLLGTPLFPGFVGTLDVNGQATAAMVLPPGLTPLLIGQELTIAGLAAAPPWTATTHVDVLLVP